MSAPFIAICGPTASGKSALSVALAKLLNAEILSFDASQVYIGADIGTAKITTTERKSIKHHLLDLVPAYKTFEAGNFIEEADKSYKTIIQENKLPILCVGTTMYFSLFLEGIAETGKGSTKVREELEQKSNQELYLELQSKDPKRALALHPNDRLRVIRALEIISTTGVLPSQAYQLQTKAQRYHGLIFVLCWDRQELSQKIEQRSKKMLADGLLDECQSILKQLKTGESAQILESIGYAESLDFLAGKISLQELEASISLHTRQLAKRQMTFWRRFPEKMGFNIEPSQNFQAEKQSKKNSQLDPKCLKLDLNQLFELSKAYINDSLHSKPCTKLVYIDGRAILEALAVS